ncbi:MAG TPA: hypothetical protein VK215_07430, partial [Acidimicrobiales bacterium]|nr:hypothetical protein [Acidimicrobiales bacterium]
AGYPARPTILAHMGTAFAGRRAVSPQLTEAFDRPGPHLGTQRPAEGQATLCFVEAPGRVPAQPRTAPGTGAHDQLSVGTARQPDQLGGGGGPPATHAGAAGGYAVLSG